MSIGHKGAIQAAKIIAMAGSELLQDKELLQQAKAELLKQPKDNLISALFLLMWRSH